VAAVILPEAVVLPLPVAVVPAVPAAEVAVPLPEVAVVPLPVAADDNLFNKKKQS
jgi:hypothetical protein